MEHTKTFPVPPSAETLRLWAESVLTRPFPVTGYRWILNDWPSPEGRTFTLVEVDVLAELRRTTIQPSRDTLTVPLTLTCRGCRRQYQGWMVLRKDMYENKPIRQSTAYCPACPPLAVDMWLAGLGIYTEEPPDAVRPSRPTRTVRPVRTTTTVNLDDYD